MPSSRPPRADSRSSANRSSADRHYLGATARRVLAVFRPPASPLCRPQAIVRALFPAQHAHGWGAERRWQHTTQGISTLLVEGLLVVDAKFEDLYRVTPEGLELLEANPSWEVER